MQFLKNQNLYFKIRSTKFPYSADVFSLISSLIDMQCRVQTLPTKQGDQWNIEGSIGLVQNMAFKQDPWDKVQIAYPNKL